MSSSTLISSFSSGLLTVDATSTLPVELASSILDFFGMVVVLDHVRDAIGDVILSASSFGSVVFAVFYCLVLGRVRNEIDGAIGASCPTNSGVCAVFCCLCDGLSLLFFPHEGEVSLYFCVLFGSVKTGFGISMIVLESLGCDSFIAYW